MGYIGQAPANKAVKTADIEDSAITAAKIADGTVVAGELASDAVTTAKILNANVTTAKLADDAITLAKMASGTDGNIISYDASGNPVAIATGSDGQVLTSTGAGSPPAFEAAAAGGKVLQVVSHQLITSKEITSNSYTGTNLTLTITPAHASNKILIVGSIWFVLLGNAAGVSAIDYRLKRNIASAGETLVHTIGDTQGLISSNTDLIPYSDARFDGMASINFIDSPSTTSSTVYSIDFRNITNYSGCNINGAWSGGTGTSHPVSTIHALEIDGT